MLLAGSPARHHRLHPGARCDHQAGRAPLAHARCSRPGASPLWVADVAGFVLALLIVTFLHLVVGEMAPKSWAIAHPETSATLLAIPMRGVHVGSPGPLLRRAERRRELVPAPGRRRARRPGRRRAEPRRPAAPASSTRPTSAPSTRPTSRSSPAPWSCRTSPSRDLLDRTRRRPTVGAARRPPPTTSARPPAPRATCASCVGRRRRRRRGRARARHARRRRATAPRPTSCGRSSPLAAQTPVYAALTAMRETRNHLALVVGGAGSTASSRWPTSWPGCSRRPRRRRRRRSADLSQILLGRCLHVDTDTRRRHDQHDPGPRHRDHRPLRGRREAVQHEDARRGARVARGDVAQPAGAQGQPGARAARSAKWDACDDGPEVLRAHGGRRR